MPINTGAVRAGRAFVEITADNTKFLHQLHESEASFRNFGSQLTQVSAQMLSAMTAVAAPLALSSKLYSEFDDVMRSVYSTAGQIAKVDMSGLFVESLPSELHLTSFLTIEIGKITAEARKANREFMSLTNTARELGATTSYTAKQAADAMLVLARAGFTISEIQDSVSHILNLARSTGTEVSEATQIMIGALRSFNIEASKSERVVDLLVATANSSPQALSDIGSAMKYIGPVAKALHLSLRDTLADLGALANFNIKGEQGGTALRNIYLRLASVKNQTKLRDLFGVEMVDAEGEFKKIVPVLREVQAHIKETGMTTAEVADAFKEIFGMRSAPAALSLMNADLSKIEAALSDVTNLAEDQAKMMDAGMGGAIRLLISRLQDLQLAFTNAFSGPATLLIKGLTAAFRAISYAIEKNKGVIKFVSYIVGGIGLVTAGFGAMSLAIGVVSRSLSSLMTQFRKLGSFKPPTRLFDSKLIVGKANDVGGQENIRVQEVDRAREATRYLNENVSSLSKAVVNSIQRFNRLGNSFDMIANKAGAFRKACDSIRSSASSILSIIKPVTTGIEKATDQFKRLTKSVNSARMSTNRTTQALNKMNGSIHAARSSFTSFDNLVIGLTGNLDKLFLIFDTARTEINLTKSEFNSLKSEIKDLDGELKKILSVSRKLTTAFNNVSNKINNATTKLKGFNTEMVETAKQSNLDVWELIKNKANDLWRVFKGLADVTKSFVSALRSIGKVSEEVLDRVERLAKALNIIQGWFLTPPPTATPPAPANPPATPAPTTSKPPQQPSSSQNKPEKTRPEDDLDFIEETIKKLRSMAGSLLAMAKEIRKAVNIIVAAIRRLKDAVKNLLDNFIALENGLVNFINNSTKLTTSFKDLADQIKLTVNTTKEAVRGLRQVKAELKGLSLAKTVKDTDRLEKGMVALGNSMRYIVENRSSVESTIIGIGSAFEKAATGAMTMAQAVQAVVKSLKDLPKLASIEKKLKGTDVGRAFLGRGKEKSKTEELTDKQLKNLQESVRRASNRILPEYSHKVEFETEKQMRNRRRTLDAAEQALANTEAKLKDPKSVLNIREELTRQEKRKNREIKTIEDANQQYMDVLQAEGTKITNRKGNNKSRQARKKDIEGARATFNAFDKPEILKDIDDRLFLSQNVVAGKDQRLANLQNDIDTIDNLLSPTNNPQYSQLSASDISQLKADKVAKKTDMIKIRRERSMEQQYVDWLKNIRQLSQNGIVLGDRPLTNDELIALSKQIGDPKRGTTQIHRQAYDVLDAAYMEIRKGNKPAMSSVTTTESLDRELASVNSIIAQNDSYIADRQSVIDKSRESRDSKVKSLMFDRYGSRIGKTKKGKSKDDILRKSFNANEERLKKLAAKLDSVGRSSDADQVRNFLSNVVDPLRADAKFVGKPVRDKHGRLRANRFNNQAELDAYNQELVQFNQFSQQVGMKGKLQQLTNPFEVIEGIRSKRVRSAFNRNKKNLTAIADAFDQAGNAQQAQKVRDFIQNVVDPLSQDAKFIGRNVRDKNGNVRANKLNQQTEIDAYNQGIESIRQAATSAGIKGKGTKLTDLTASVGEVRKHPKTGKPLPTDPYRDALNAGLLGRQAAQRQRASDGNLYGAWTDAELQKDPTTGRSIRDEMYDAARTDVHTAGVELRNQQSKLTFRKEMEPVLGKGGTARRLEYAEKSVRSVQKVIDKLEAKKAKTGSLTPEELDQYWTAQNNLTVRNKALERAQARHKAATEKAQQDIEAAFKNSKEYKALEKAEKALNTAKQGGNAQAIQQAQANVDVKRADYERFRNVDMGYAEVKSESERAKVDVETATKNLDEAKKAKEALQKKIKANNIELETAKEAEKLAQKTKDQIREKAQSENRDLTEQEKADIQELENKQTKAREEIRDRKKKNKEFANNLQEMSDAVKREKKNKRNALSYQRQVDTALSLFQTSLRGNPFVQDVSKQERAQANAYYKSAKNEFMNNNAWKGFLTRGKVFKQNLVDIGKYLGAAATGFKKTGSSAQKSVLSLRAAAAGFTIMNMLATTFAGIMTMVVQMIQMTVVMGIVTAILGALSMLGKWLWGFVSKSKEERDEEAREKGRQLFDEKISASREKVEKAKNARENNEEKTDRLRELAKKKTLTQQESMEATKLSDAVSVEGQPIYKSYMTLGENGEFVYKNTIDTEAIKASRNLAKGKEQVEILNSLRKAVDDAPLVFFNVSKGGKIRGEYLNNLIDEFKARFEDLDALGELTPEAKREMQNLANEILDEMQKQGFVEGAGKVSALVSSYDSEDSEKHREALQKLLEMTNSFKSNGKIFDVDSIMSSLEPFEQDVTDALTAKKVNADEVTEAYKNYIDKLNESLTSIQENFDESVNKNAMKIAQENIRKKLDDVYEKYSNASYKIIRQLESTMPKYGAEADLNKAFDNTTKDLEIVENNRKKVLETTKVANEAELQKAINLITSEYSKYEKYSDIENDINNRIAQIDPKESEENKNRVTQELINEKNRRLAASVMTNPYYQNNEKLNSINQKFDKAINDYKSSVEKEFPNLTEEERKSKVEEKTKQYENERNAAIVNSVLNGRNRRNDGNDDLVDAKRKERDAKLEAEKEKSKQKQTADEKAVNDKYDQEIKNVYNAYALTMQQSLDKSFEQTLTGARASIAKAQTTRQARLQALNETAEKVGFNATMEDRRKLDFEGDTMNAKERSELIDKINKESAAATAAYKESDAYKQQQKAIDKEYKQAINPRKILNSLSPYQDSFAALTDQLENVKDGMDEYVQHAVEEDLKPLQMQLQEEKGKDPREYDAKKVSALEKQIEAKRAKSMEKHQKEAEQYQAAFEKGLEKQTYRDLYSQEYAQNKFASTNKGADYSRQLQIDSLDYMINQQKEIRDNAVKGSEEFNAAAKRILELEVLKVMAESFKEAAEKLEEIKAKYAQKQFDYALSHFGLEDESAKIDEERDTKLANLETDYKKRLETAKTKEEVDTLKADYEAYADFVKKQAEFKKNNIGYDDMTNPLEKQTKDLTVQYQDRLLETLRARGFSIKDIKMDAVTGEISAKDGNQEVQDIINFSNQERDREIESLKKNFTTPFQQKKKELVKNYQDQLLETLDSLGISRDVVKIDKDGNMHSKNKEAKRLIDIMESMREKEVEAAKTDFSNPVKQKAAEITARWQKDILAALDSNGIKDVWVDAMGEFHSNDPRGAALIKMGKATREAQIAAVEFEDNKKQADYKVKSNMYMTTKPIIDQIDLSIASLETMTSGNEQADRALDMQVKQLRYNKAVLEARQFDAQLAALNQQAQKAFEIWQTASKKGASKEEVQNAFDRYAQLADEIQSTRTNMINAFKEVSSARKDYQQAMNNATNAAEVASTGTFKAIEAQSSSWNQERGNIAKQQLSCLRQIANNTSIQEIV